MNIRTWLVGGAMSLALLAGCSKKEAATVATPAPEAPKPVTMTVVKAEERSRHFLAVSKHLELGGTLFGYVDIDGDALKLAGMVQNLTDEMAKASPMAAAQLNQDYAALFKILGLTDIKAVGLSSVPDGTGFFRNRVFLHTPEERHGLLAGLGGSPAPFTRLALAPANSDFFGESEVDLPVVYQTIKTLVAKVAGEANAAKMEAALDQAGQEAGISALKIIQNWKGHMAVVGRIEEGPGFRTPGRDGVQLPAFSLLISIDGVAPTLRDALVKIPVFKQRLEGTLELFELGLPLPVPGLNPVIAIEGSTLMIATSPTYLTECRQATDRLTQSAEFQKALAPFGSQGNSLAYVSPVFFTKLRQLDTLNPELPAESQRVIRMVLANLPACDRPLVTVRTNLPDGILIQSYWNRSLKQDVAVLAFYNPITVGLLAAMAIPAFQKVRMASQEKIVLNNLIQLQAAGEQYCMEHDKASATYDDVVGPDNFIRELNPVAGENYRQLVIKPGQPLRVRLASGKVIQYPPR